MYYAFEFRNGEWMEIGYSTCAKALEAHLLAEGVKIYHIVGW